MTALHNVYFHVWHFLYQQSQLTNWFGNIVAGVVSFVALTLAWPRLRHAVERAIGITKLHNKLDAQHLERLNQADQHHREALALAKKHHEAQLKALKPEPPKPTRTRKPTV